MTYSYEQITDLTDSAIAAGNLYYKGTKDGKPSISTTLRSALT